VNAVVTDETRRDYSAAQYVEGFDACTREVTDCLQTSHSFAVSAELYAGLLDHLAARRRRLLLARGRDQQHATVSPPGESVRLGSQDENANCAQTGKLVRQIRAVAGVETARSALASIDNVQVGCWSTAETSTNTVPAVNCTRLVNTRHSESTDQPSPPAELSLTDTAVRSVGDDESCTSRDTAHLADCDCASSTDDDVTSPMWRPW